NWGTLVPRPRFQAASARPDHGDASASAQRPSKASRPTTAPRNDDGHIVRSQVAPANFSGQGAPRKSNRASISSIAFGDLLTIEHRRHAGADEVTVAVGVVDAVDRGPIFVTVQPGRIAAKRPRIWPFPFLIDEIECGMRR